MTRVGDAERLLEIQDVGRAIASKEPSLKTARAQRDADRQIEADCRKAVQVIDARIAEIGREVHLTGGAVYLNGDSLDRGTLVLGNETLRFSGWRGAAEVLLGAISEMQLGTSYLPARAGMPFISRFWPGEPRSRGTLLITVERGVVRSQTGEGVREKRQVALADLESAEMWRNQITVRVDLLKAVADRRADLQAQRREPAAALDRATTDLHASERALDVIEQEIASLRELQNRLKAQQRAIDAARERDVREARKSGGKR